MAAAILRVAALVSTTGGKLPLSYGGKTELHDSNVIEPLIEEKDKGQDLYLDAGYESNIREIYWLLG